MQRIATGLAILTALVTAQYVFGQTLDRPVGLEVPWVVDSGEWKGTGSEAQSVWLEDVILPDAAWVRLYFSDVRLEGASLLRISSYLDGETQWLDAKSAKMWGNTSAYFNGNAVLIELVAAPNTSGNRVVLRAIAYEPVGVVPVEVELPGERGSPGQCGIVGSDDRYPRSTAGWVCRLMPVGCSASVYATNSSMIGAGHCVGPNQVAEFMVPASRPDCTLVHPPVADQFPVGSTISHSNGIGDDWSVMACGTNNLGQRPYDRYGQYRQIATVVAQRGNFSQVWGYGVDTTCTLSQTHQISPGYIDGRFVFANPARIFYTFTSDVRSGNSGSPLVVGGKIVGVVTHCSTTVNYGTAVDQPSFASHRALFDR